MIRPRSFLLGGTPLFGRAVIALALFRSVARWCSWTAVAVRHDDLARFDERDPPREFRAPADTRAGHPALHEDRRPGPGSRSGLRPPDRACRAGRQHLGCRHVHGPELKLRRQLAMSASPAAVGMRRRLMVSSLWLV